MSQEPPKSNAVLIAVAVIGVLGTIAAAAIAAISNYNIEELRQQSEQGNSTQQVAAQTINSPTTQPPAFTASSTDIVEPVMVASSTFGEGAWKGTLSQGSSSHDMSIIVERVDAPYFYGKIHLPTLGNSIMEMEGRILTSAEVNDVVEQSKWSYVEGFDAKQSQIWLSFHYTSTIQTSVSIITSATYKGVLEGSAIRGAWYYSPTDSEPDGYFTVFAEP